MTQESLAQQLQASMGKKPVETLAEALISKGFPPKKLMLLCMHKDHKISFHAAWVLEQMCIRHFEYFSPSFLSFIILFPNVYNASVKRHFAKILVHCLGQLTDPKYVALASYFWKESHEALVQTLFEWLIDPSVRPGVKVWCMDALKQLAPHYPWIHEELTPTVQALLVDASQGLRVRGKRLLETH